MAYLRPIQRISGTKVESFGRRLIYNRDDISNNFEYGPYTYSLESLTDEPIILFDLPANMVVQIGQVSLPATIFDYFNPLIVTKTLAKKLLFIDTIPRDTFECSRLWVPTQVHENIKKLTASQSMIFRYSPYVGIIYPEMKVVQISPEHPQLMKFFLGVRMEDTIDDVFISILSHFMTELFHNSSGGLNE